MSKKSMKVHYMSLTNEWATPQELFDRINMVYGPFTLDPCCTKKSAKCDNFFTEKEDGLSQDWGNHSVFVNPPYGRKIGQWIKKAFNSSLQGATVTCLIPSRTDTKYWHEYCMKADHIVFFSGRIHFDAGDGKSAPAPFPSCLVIFDGTNKSILLKKTPFSTMKARRNKS